MIGKLFVISGPSGAGKTTLVAAALEELKDPYPIKRVITHTTRPIRSGEIEGQDYYFVSVEEFKQKIEEGFFLEWSNWYDNYYGSPISILESIKRDEASFIAVLDQAGAREVLATYSEAVLVWIQPSSLSLLIGRLKKRGKNTPEEIDSRLKKAEVELEQKKREGLYSTTVINDDFVKAKDELILIIKESIKLQ
jgi:guanylate kinase